MIPTGMAWEVIYQGRGDKKRIEKRDFGLPVNEMGGLGYIDSR